MARINLQGNQYTPGARRPNPIPSNAGDAQRGQAFADLGSSMVQVTQRLIERKSAAYATTALTQYKNEAITMFAAATNQRDADNVEGFSPEFVKELDVLAASYVERAPNRLSAQLFLQNVENIKSNFFEKALSFENATLTAHHIANVTDVINTSANGLLVAPDEFADSLATTLQSIQAVSDLMTDDETRRLAETAENSLAVSAVRGQISDDPKLAMAQLEEGEWDRFLRPEQKNSLMKLATDARSNSNAVIAYETEEAVRAEIAQIEETGNGNGITREWVRSRFEEAGMASDRAEVEARKYEAARETASSVFNAVNQIAYASASDRSAIVESFRPKEGDPNFDKKMGVYRGAQQRRMQIDEFLDKDPMGYVLTNDQIKEMFDPALGGSPQRGMVAALTMQAKMLNSDYDSLREQGMSVNDILRQTEGLQVLTQEQSDSLVNRLNTSDPNELYSVLGGLRETYGSVLGDTSVYNRVLNELANNGLNGGMAFAINAAEFGVPGTVELIAAINISTKELQDSLANTGTRYQDVQLEVASVLAPFKQAFVAGDIGQIGYFNEIQEAITKMAAQRVASGLSPTEGDAAKYAYEQVIDAMFAVTETALIPRKNTFGEPQNVELIERNMNRVLDLSHTPLIQRALQERGSFPGPDDAFTQERRFNQLKSTGMFINAPNGEGYHLRVMDLNTPMYFEDTSGNPVIFTDFDLGQMFHGSTDREAVVDSFNRERRRGVTYPIPKFK